MTRKEVDSLASFLENPGKAIMTPNLLQSVWGDDPAQYTDTHTIEVHVSNLRRMLGP